MARRIWKGALLCPNTNAAPDISCLNPNMGLLCLIKDVHHTSHDCHEPYPFEVFFVVERLKMLKWCVVSQNKPNGREDTVEKYTENQQSQSTLKVPGLQMF